MKLQIIRMLAAFSFIGFTSVSMFGQYAYSPDILKPVLPKSFVISEYETVVEKYAPDYLHLLDICDGEVDVAFTKWLEMLTAMEAESQKSEIDLKGVKMWLQVYFSEDGKIDHIGYFLKPNSKNIDQLELKAFLEKFAQTYKFPVDAANKFSHYTAVSFPVFSGS